MIYGRFLQIVTWHVTLYSSRRSFPCTGSRSGLSVYSAKRMSLVNRRRALHGRFDRFGQLRAARPGRHYHTVGIQQVHRRNRVDVELLGQPRFPAAAFGDLIANSDNLLRAWYFDPSSQDVAPDFGWFLYDPRPVFAAANTYAAVETGNFIWVLAREGQTATICGTSRTLFAGWNPVVC